MNEFTASTSMTWGGGLLKLRPLPPEWVVHHLYHPGAPRADVLEFLGQGAQEPVLLCDAELPTAVASIMTMVHETKR